MEKQLGISLLIGGLWGTWISILALLTFKYDWNVCIVPLFGVALPTIIIGLFLLIS